MRAREREPRHDRAQGRQIRKLRPRPAHGELGHVVQGVGGADDARGADPLSATRRIKCGPSRRLRASRPHARRARVAARRAPAPACGLGCAQIEAWPRRCPGSPRPGGYAGAYRAASQRIGCPWSSHVASLTSGAPGGVVNGQLHPQLPIEGGLHAEAHHPGVLAQRALDRRPLVGLDVLAHDRVPYHGRARRRRRAQHLGQPLRALARHHRDRIAGGYRRGRRAGVRSGASSSGQM